MLKYFDRSSVTNNLLNILPSSDGRPLLPLYCRTKLDRQWIYVWLSILYLTLNLFPGFNVGIQELTTTKYQKVPGNVFKKQF